MTESNRHKRLLFIAIVGLSGLYFVYKIHDRRNFFSFKKDQLQFAPYDKINCPLFGFNDLPTNKLPIYDFFLFGHELDTLEIRLHELYEYVTLFLIAESEMTFSGKRKPLYLKENWSRFAKYHDKIRRVEVNLTDSNDNTTTSWSKEARSRYDGIRLALPKPSKDFLLLTSDVDEIPKARFVRALANCGLPIPFPHILLKCDFYFYSYEFRSAVDYYSDGGTVSRFTFNETVPLNLRTSRQKFPPMSGACFHCSYCFDRISLVREKISSFSHTELDVEKYRNKQHIIDRFKNGQDLYDRLNAPLRRAEANETELPKLLKEQPQLFMYMLNRSHSATAAFRDA